MILNLDEAPDDPIRRLLWLSGVHEQAVAELAEEFQQTYYRARLEGRLDSALALKLHSRKRALAFTRRENERRGRSISRWPDA